MLEKEKGCGEYKEGSGEQGRVGDRAAQRKLALTDSKCNWTGTHTHTHEHMYVYVVCTHLLYLDYDNVGEMRHEKRSWPVSAIGDEMEVKKKVEGGCYQQQQQQHQHQMFHIKVQNECGMCVCVC